MVTTMAHFPAVGNTLFSLQFRRNAPNSLWFMIQSCQRFEPLAKQNAAATVGVLQGIPGVTTPIYAMPRNIMPRNIMPRLTQKIFLTFSISYLS